MLAATYDYDLFVVHAAADSDFVRSYLLPALALPRHRLLLVDELPLGGLVVAEIDRGVARSRYTVAVLSPAYLEDCWAHFGEQLATSLSMSSPRVIPLRLIDCTLPCRLEARIALDFTDEDRWDGEVARLRDLVASDAAVPPIRPLRPRRRSRRRQLLGFLGGAIAGALLVTGVTWRRSTPRAAPPADDMARFAATRVRLGVFDLDARPAQCSALAPGEDCAVLAQPASVAATGVAAFDLDRREVTNAEYAAWLNATVDRWDLAPYAIVTTRSEPAIPLLRAEKCGDGLTITAARRAHVPLEAARWPVVCVSWYGASEYCRAHGKRLPLDSEWELAAKGAGGRPFPWGADLPREDAVSFGRRHGPTPHPRAVGDAPQDVSPEGVRDLAGNAAEWVEDGHGSASLKKLRGGGFASVGPCRLLGSGCRYTAADRYQKDIGFRCARSVIEPANERWSR